MPHPRKEEAAAREKEKKDQVRAEAARKAEEGKWADDDKARNARETKQAERDRKADEQLQKSREKADLLRQEEEENAKVGKNKASKPVRKINQADIRVSALMGALADPKKKAKPAPVLVTDEPLQPNLNRVNQIETIRTGIELESGRGLIESVSVLNSVVGVAKVDIHPEKRMKAAHANFEETRLKELMMEKPGLKRSQYKEMIWREWLKSPENPLRDSAPK